jgi:hypothetical protein
MMAHVKPRLHVLLASHAPLGVVIRRGPTKRACTILWDRRRDHFRLGQWLKGRIYERRSDLSTDGEHLIFFAMNGKWESEAKGAWTAISRVPYLKAIALFPKGDCWHGGGLFTSRDTYWLNDGHGHSVLHDTGEVRRDTNYQPPGPFGGECLGVYYPRLFRDGWNLVRRVNVAKWKDYDVLEKPVRGGWTLRKIAHAQLGPPVGKGVYWDEHELVHPETERLIRCPDWEWADIDGDRLVWVEGGSLFAGTLLDDGVGHRTQLHDFDGMIFEPVEAPY